MTDDPLARPAWNALTSLQAHHATGNALALRFVPEIGPIAAAGRLDEAGLAALSALVPAEGVLATLEPEPYAPPPGTVFERQSAALQMAAHSIPEPFEDARIRRLGPADAAQMRALAMLTEPGPFAERTHELGTFWGICEGDRLLAMTGERMRMPGFGEVSAVCVHPDARGRGYGLLLTRKAMSNLGAQGLRPFLHVYADNAPAIATYERAGFRKARDMVITMIRRAG